MWLAPLCIRGRQAAVSQRLTGLQDGLPHTIDLKVVKSSNWTEEGGYHAVSSWLKLSDVAPVTNPGRRRTKMTRLHWAPGAPLKRSKAIQTRRGPTWRFLEWTAPEDRAGLGGCRLIDGNCGHTGCGWPGVGNRHSGYDGEEPASRTARCSGPILPQPGFAPAIGKGAVPSRSGHGKPVARLRPLSCDGNPELPYSFSKNSQAEQEI